MKPVQIVLIEDNPADISLVEIALEERGIQYSLIKFESGQEAVRVLCGAPVDGNVLPDAILLDLNTPRTDGFEALRSFQQSPWLSKVPIAILTSSQAQRDRHRAALQGVRYIVKPSQLDAFLTVVGAAVGEMLQASAAY